MVQQSKDPDSVANLNKVKVCIYIDALSNFLNGLQTKTNKAIFEFSQITTKVENHIREKFARPHDKKM